MLSAMAGKKGGKRQTVSEEAHVDTITIMKMFSCLQYVHPKDPWKVFSVNSYVLGQKTGKD